MAIFVNVINDNKSLTVLTLNKRKKTRVTFGGEGRSEHLFAYAFEYVL